MALSVSESCAFAAQSDCAVAYETDWTYATFARLHERAATFVEAASESAHSMGSSWIMTVPSPRISGKGR